MFVLDASTTAAWFFEDELTEAALDIRERLRQSSALVPVMWPLEIANILLVGERRGRLTAAQIQAALDLLAELPIALTEPQQLSEVSDLLKLGRVYKISSCDASYLALARREQIPLATLDGRLRDTALEAGIQLLPSPIKNPEKPDHDEEQGRDAPAASG